MVWHIDFDRHDQKDLFVCSRCDKHTRKEPCLIEFIVMYLYQLVLDSRLNYFILFLMIY